MEHVYIESSLELSGRGGGGDGVGNSGGNGGDRGEGISSTGSIFDEAPT